MSEICSGDKSQKNITLGVISSAYGIKGWVKVHPFTEAQDSILNYKLWHLEINGKTSSHVLEAGRIHGKSIVVKFESVNDRDQAARLCKANVIVTRDELPELAAGTYYWSDLEGLEVYNIEGKRYGLVDHLFETGANDVMVVKGDKEILVPFIQGEYIKEVDLDKGVIRVDWPEEL